ncbi:TPA: hypothetical protein DCP77_00845 [Candidatus Collierbacteria bacterium]|uniref:DUF1566 domain-containing protein n=1 Tax=Candidatus Collierbacteria bacterium GW2011_GWA2_42_17 TaxID=1618378 RepID=A0A0G0Z276_9BACT|nr:MAG: hypothetical protein UU94_C0002G0014 [Candidatus Collierbacteria bacterium GW2011_GWB2_42_12]KKS42872.1 MAG: hypothetical protein UV06_C0004G0007 [Candidatus Collierbacteria bacterium GW2011_GWA2_42_17]KKS62982.1 MAG: hypothetical protein UV28_C0002G0005 [Candidatus Collierbacteria bacterium GW2011_GWE2_42_48]KKS63280.1 MAG: hypothetical protein UV29_C0004G0037 [Candidatus Collierbacteria bacterium GW2011_GWD2_42_50]KKS63323.1 MAG: hypothetical protein UV30_C0004G0036 [Candidatus Collie
MWFRTKEVVNWSLLFILLLLLSFLTFYFGSAAIAEYFERVYISDFEFFGALWLVCTTALIFVASCMDRKAKGWSKIAIYFLVLLPQALTATGIISEVVYIYGNTSKFEAKVSWEKKTIELAPPGPGFPIVPTDFPGNHLIPWLGWVNGTSWDKASETCSHLDKEGKNLVNSQQNIWRLPTLEETREVAKANRVWSPNFSVWWTATTSEYERCWVSKNGQCHIIFQLATGNEVKANYVPLLQAYRCVRDFK